MAVAVAVASLKVYLTTLLSKVFSFKAFLGGQGRDLTVRDVTGHMDRQTFLGKYYFRLEDYFLKKSKFFNTGFFFYRPISSFTL